MEELDLIKNMKQCAEMLYQNREQEAYQMIHRILPEMNQMLQKRMLSSNEMGEMVLSALNEFVEDFQKKDNLGLADLLGYTIPGMIRACGVEEENHPEGSEQILPSYVRIMEKE